MPATDTSNIATVVLYTTKREFILQRRDQLAPTAPGRLCLFGGHIQHNESPLQAIRRELHEEISAKIIQPNYLCTFRHYTEPEGANQPVDFYVFCAPVQSHHFYVYEGKGAEWISFSDFAANPDVISSARDAMRWFLRKDLMA